MSAPGLRDRKKQQTWNDLRDAGLRLAVERGYENVGVDEIAAAANVSKRTLFNYFDSKEDLLFGPDPAEPERLAEIARSRPAGEPLWDSLREIVLGYVATHEAKLRLQKRVMNASSPALAGVSAASGAALQRVLESCVADRGDATPMRTALFAGAAMTALRAAFTNWQPEQNLDGLTGLVRDGFELLGRGLLGHH